jgi:hypothetical protein
LVAPLELAHRPLLFEIQAGGATAWRRAIDTSLPSPQEIVEPGGGAEVVSGRYTAAAHSVVVLTRSGR